LIAEAFDFAVLKTAEWLSEAYGVSIKCYRLEYVSDDPSEYISCVCIFPPADIADQATRVRKGKVAQPTTTSSSWPELVSEVENPNIRAFFEKDLPDGEKRLRSRDVAFRIKGDRRLHVGVRRNHAYVWQTGRFDGDEEFWKGVLSEPLKVQPVDSGRSLRFILKTTADVQGFEKALKDKLQKVVFTDRDDSLFVEDDGEPTHSSVLAGTRSDSRCLVERSGLGVRSG